MTSPRLMSISSASRSVTDCGAKASVSSWSPRSMPATVVRRPDGQHHDLVPDLHDAGGELTGIPPVVAVRGVAGRALRPDDELHRHPERLVRRVVGGREASRAARAGSGRRTRAVRVDRSDDVVAVAAPRPARRARPARRGRRRARRTWAATRSKTSSAKSTRSILLTATTTCGTRSRAATARWRRVCSSTPLRASTSSDDDVGGRAAGDGVAGVLHVAGAVREDERAVAVAK